MRREALPIRLHRADIRRRRWHSEFCFQRRDARFEGLVFLARQPRHVLDRLELLALDDVEVAQDFFGLIADHRIDLTLDALGGAGGVIHQTPDLVEKPIAGLGHLKKSPVGCELVGKSDNGDPEGAVQGRCCPLKGQSPCHDPVSLQSYPTSSQEAEKPETKSNAMIDQQIEIPTKDGHVTTFISHPERDGPHPVIIFYMDAPAIREELRDMDRRLGTSGYYVMLPNMYYRSGVMEIGPIPPDPD